jgi:hypothetical protein
MPHIIWTVAAGLAVGSFAAVAMGRTWAAVTRGFLVAMATCATAFGLLAVFVDGTLPLVTGKVHADPGLELPRQALLILFTILAAGTAVAEAAGRRATLLVPLTLGSGIAALFVAGLGWGGGFPAGVPLAVQFGVLALATGGAVATALLAVELLMRPGLPEEPLVHATRLLALVVAVQIALFVSWLGGGIGPSHSPVAPLVGGWAGFVWVRLIVGLVAPLVVAWIAHTRALKRRFAPATWLLLADAGLIAVGTAVAAGLYFGGGLLL